jgi:SNF2 family DNA or RNA helicase/uncharacterized Zn finger protein
MAIQFGKTWWGARWLSALEQVDYDNRLPRGASYARAGHVTKVKIRENLIFAKVTGTRQRPYDVIIIIPPFSTDQVNLLMTKIIEQPVLVSKLLNRELDPAVLEIAEGAGLPVFPQRWTDFQMNCSCPDWTIPCRHIAAVIYMLSREIDNNPFLVFNLHKVNLLEELTKRGIYIADQRRTEIPTLDSLLKINKSKDTGVAAEAVYERVDFSLLHNISEAMVQLLPNAPLFYPEGNFRDKYAVQYNHIIKQTVRIFSKKVRFSTFFPNLSDKRLTNRSALGLILDNYNQVVITGRNHSFIRMEELISALFQLSPDHLSDFEPSVAAFHKILFTALHLLANGMMIPQFVQLDSRQFIIRWLPAVMDSRVKAILDKLSKILPVDLLLSRKTVHIRNAKTMRAVSFQPVENQATELVSLFLSKIVAHLSKSSNHDLYEDLFFKNKSCAFSSAAESSLSGGIKVWLNRYYITDEIYKPIITVSELPDEQFDVQISIEDHSLPEMLPVPLENILNEKRYEKQRFKILQSVSLLSPFIRGLDAHINLRGSTPIQFSNSEFAPFLMEVLPAIRLLDIKIMLPKALRELLRPKVSMKLKKSEKGKGFVRLGDLLSFNWQVAIGDKIISPEEFSHLMEKASRLFKFKENYIYVSDADIERLHKAFTNNKPLNSYELLQTALSEEYDGAPILLSEEVKSLIRELTSTEDIPLPESLTAQLRPYQQRGYSWMYRNSRIGFGSIIADDMGLGKTLQVISILLKFKEEKSINEKHKALVVVPTGLLTNWQAEIDKFAPSLSSHIFHGASRDIKQFEADVMLTTYGVLRSDTDVLKRQKWHVMVIDEAQNIKNNETSQAKAVKSIPATIRIAMSGTPVENRPTEFWSIMDFANKGYLGNVKSFKDDYANPIQLFNDELVTAKFRKVTAPFMMRRMKSDKSIISDLPDKIEQNQFAQLSKQQASLYQKTMLVAMDEIEGCAVSDNQSLFKRQGLVLQMILALKQICNHPTQFLKNGQFDASLSGKTDLLFELLDSITQNNEKVLIFTQFKEMGDLLVRFITERFEETPLFYHGGCTLAQREDLVNRFQHNRADKIFILSLRAAGTGLNLTAASHVIHYDLWWNPAVENQATDRAYRIGQTKNVMVHRMICKNTFEERINEMIQQKKHLADVTVATGESWIGKLSNKELRDIFG